MGDDVGRPTLVSSPSVPSATGANALSWACGGHNEPRLALGPWGRYLTPILPPWVQSSLLSHLGLVLPGWVCSVGHLPMLGQSLAYAWALPLGEQPQRAPGVEKTPTSCSLYPLDLRRLAVRTRRWPLLGCGACCGVCVIGPLPSSISQVALQLLRCLRQKVLHCFKKRKNCGKIYIT